MQKAILLNSSDTKFTTVNNAVIQLGDIDDTGKGRHFISRFIQAGLVKIENHGIVLLKKETLDASLPTIVGAPVIIQHKDITEDNADELRCGVISNARYNEFDGWYYVEGVIWDEKAIELINKGWSVSCSYDFLAFNDDGGIENNIKYDKEFTQLNFTHLAIVDNPRYERANIVFNSKIANENQYHKPKGTADGGQFSEAPEDFKNSQIKNPDGKLLDIFHGSPEDFEEFKENELGIFFSSSEAIAKTYRKKKNGILYTTNINLQNPLELDVKGANWNKINGYLKTDEVAKFVKDNNYDGLILKNVVDVGTYPISEDKHEYDKPHTDYIVFNPKNIHIKSKQILNNINNSKEQDMAILEELKKLIVKVENEKGEDMDDKEQKEVENEKVDKRKLIDEVGGILKGKVDDEIIRTIIKKMEEMSYDASEDSKADNKKVKNEEDKEEDKKVENEEDKEEDVENKCKNEAKEDKEKVEEVKEDVKEDVDNKCKNSKDDITSFDKINEIYNSVRQLKEEKKYVSRQEKLDNAVEYFK